MLHNELVQTIGRAESAVEFNAIIVRKCLGQMGVTLIRDPAPQPAVAATTNKPSPAVADHESSSSCSCSHCSSINDLTTSTTPTAKQQPQESNNRHYYDFIDTAGTNVASSKSLAASRTSRTKLHKFSQDLSGGFGGGGAKYELIQSRPSEPFYYNNGRATSGSVSSSTVPSSILLMIQSNNTTAGSRRVSDAARCGAGATMSSFVGQQQTGNPNMQCGAKYTTSSSSKFNVIGEQETLV